MTPSPNCTHFQSECVTVIKRSPHLPSPSKRGYFDRVRITCLDFLGHFSGHLLVSGSSFHRVVDIFEELIRLGWLLHMILKNISGASWMQDAQLWSRPGPQRTKSYLGAELTSRLDVPWSFWFPDPDNPSEPEDMALRVLEVLTQCGRKQRQGLCSVRPTPALLLLGLSAAGPNHPDTKGKSCPQVVCQEGAGGRGVSTWGLGFCSCLRTRRWLIWVPSPVRELRSWKPLWTAKIIF